MEKMYRFKVRFHTTARIGNGGGRVVLNCKSYWLVNTAMAVVAGK
jgi:hypothetical protein